MSLVDIAILRPCRGLALIIDIEVSILPLDYLTIKTPKVNVFTGV
jgi:hypothetical protein